METLDGKTVSNVTAVAIRKESHPLKANTDIFRAYEMESDGSLYPLYIGRETVDEVKQAVSMHLSHKAVIFCEI